MRGEERGGMEISYLDAFLELQKTCHDGYKKDTRCSGERLGFLQLELSLNHGGCQKHTETTMWPVAKGFG